MMVVESVGEIYLWKMCMYTFLNVFLSLFVVVVFFFHYFVFP